MFRRSAVLSPTRLAVALAAAVWLCVIVVKSPWRDLNVINADAYGYNMYLVAAVSPHGIGSGRTFDALENDYGLDHIRGYARNTLANGNVVFKYTMGMAVMNAPLFGAAHAYSLWTGTPADGFAAPYQVATALSTWLWAVCALIVTGLLLRRWFTEPVTAVVLLIIAFGTNAFYYAALTYGMSHMPSMFLFGTTLLAALAWLDRPRPAQAALVGAGLGMIGLVRPTDLVFLLVPAGAFFHHIARQPAHARAYAHLAVAAGAALAVCSPQVLYWKLMAGTWLYNGYVGEAIDLFKPHVVDGVFSFQKGWLVYTPVMVLAVLGLPLFRRRVGWLGAAVMACLAVHVYVVFSWQEWWYGGGFGARPMIQAYVILALPLASGVERIAGWWSQPGWSPRGRVKALASAAAVAGAVSLNLFQVWQLDRGILHGTHMHRAAYWQTFGVRELSEGEASLLYRAEDHAAAEDRLQRDIAGAPDPGTTLVMLAVTMVLVLVGLSAWIRAATKS